MDMGLAIFRLSIWLVERIVVSLKRMEAAVLIMRCQSQIILLNQFKWPWQFSSEPNSLGLKFAGNDYRLADVIRYP